MPFVHDYAPISAYLALGGIAGSGQAIAQRKAQQAAEQAQAVQIAQQNVANQIAQQQGEQQAQAKVQANQIQTALAYDQLNSQNARAQDELASRTANENAQRLQSGSQFQQAHTQQQTQFDAAHAQQADQFNQSNARLQEGNDLAQKKYQTSQDEQSAKDASVLQQIDTIAPPGSQENLRMRAAYTANRRLPTAPNSVTPEQSLRVLNTTRKGITDMLGYPVKGHEDEWNKLTQQINQITQSVGSAATATSQQPMIVQTDRVSPGGLPVVVAIVQGQQVPAVAIQSNDDLAKVQPGETAILPDGTIVRKK